MALSDQFKNVPHPDSDPTRSAKQSDGRVVQYINMLGCPSPGCNADFNHPMTRAWHISQRHPGVYAGASEDMAMLEEASGRDLGFNKRYTFKKGAPKPVRGVDFGPGIDKD